MRAKIIQRLIFVALIGCCANVTNASGQTTLRVPVPQEQVCIGSNCRPVPPPAAGTRTAGAATETAPNPHLGLENDQMPKVPASNDSDAPVDATEFQDFVTSSVGRKLPRYGYGLFDRVPTTFAPMDRVPVTADYVVGPGDELLVRAWGQIDLDARVTVDRAGDVYLPKVGTVTVAGLKFEQLHDFFFAAVGRVFRNFDLAVNMGQLRSIQIFVVGHARRPGVYTVSSLSTLVNALFSSGGPSTSGSMRHIQLKRNNNVVTDFDLYDLLLRGDKSKDMRLLPGDVIYIPPVGSSIAVAGSVNVSAVYELRDSTTLRQAIETAGGLATTADGQKAVVERINDRSTRSIAEFPLDEEGLTRTIKDGDVVRILSLSPRIDNAVTLRGNVARAGRYPWHPGLRVRDLIPNQEALVTREYWRDSNAISTANEARTYQKEHGGELASPQDKTSPALQSAKTRTEVTTSEFRNEITRNIPEINWDYAVIQRLNVQDLTTRLIPFNLGKLVLEKDEENNLVLEPGDIVTVFSQADLAVPLEKQTKFVRLEGEFRAAGVYKVEPGETLRHLVARVGGLTDRAYLYGAEFTRDSIRAQQQKGLDQLIRDLDEEIARSAGTPAGITPEDATERRAQLDGQRQLVEKLRQVRASGRLVLELKPDSMGPDALPEMALEDGDRFVVPYRPSTVDVLGAVYNRNSFFYRPDKRVGDYLKQAGGATRDADKDRTFVVRADGSVVSRQSYGGFWKGGFDSMAIMPGDAVVVPERLQKGTTLKALKDWTQVFAQFALGAAAVSVF